MSAEIIRQQITRVSLHGEIVMTISKETEEATPEQLKAIRDSLAIIAGIVLNEGAKMQGSEVFIFDGFELEVTVKIKGVPLLEQFLKS